MLSKNKKLVVSLFCGIGGLDLGFQSAGFEVAIALDDNPKVLELYQNNFPDTTVLCKDIGEITATERRDIIQHKQDLRTVQTNYLVNQAKYVV